MPNVTIVHGTDCLTLSAEKGQSLTSLLQEYVPSFAMPCAGNHTCGKCLVQVSGAVTPMSEPEKQLLKKYILQPNIRLACFCNVEGDVTVTIPSKTPPFILSWYKIPTIVSTEHGYGFAVDIGTTTVALQLIDRDTGLVVAERVAENAQRGFGSDVISRIEACKTAGLETLSNRIVTQLEEMAASCLRESGVEQVVESVVTGNSTMLHLYEGLDPASLAVSPFAVQSYFGCMSRHTLAGAPVYLPRCIGAYVGADITCAVLASAVTEEGTQLLTDIGTNGEIALVQNGNLICCATAAGPAFEGAGLSRGMSASAGAICAVEHIASNISYKTVDNAPPIGICGSGILDALAVMLHTEAMDETGYLEEDWEISDSGITVTQKDIRQIQLAKSAICAGIRTLLETEDLVAEDIHRFVIAGGFGSSMNHTSAAAIGLFPDALQKKAVFLGNGALGGAVMLLRSKALRDQSAKMAEAATELSLSASATFMEHYVDCMSFEVL